MAIQDELTVRGRRNYIYYFSCKGHGTVKIKDYEAFLGGSITVGYEAVMQITDNMSIRFVRAIITLLWKMVNIVVLRILLYTVMKRP